MKYMRIALWMGVTLGLFILFALPFPNMGLDSDFFGVLQDARLASSWGYFFKTSVAQMVYPLNELRSTTDFGSYYRPIWQVLHAIEWQLFGQWWQGYIWTAVLFWGMTAGTLAVIFSYFFYWLDAVLLALLWALHPALSPSFLSVTVLLAASYFFIAQGALCYVLYFQSSYKLWYFCSLVLYALGALSYDLLIIAPMPLFFFLFLFYQSRLYEILPYFAVTGSCIGLRLWVMGGLHSAHTPNVFNFVKQAIDNSIQALRPFWGLQYSSTLFALLVSITFACFIAYKFWLHERDRKYIVWLILSFFAGSWGIIIGNSSSRYFALGLPFFALLLFWLVRTSFSKKKSMLILASMLCLSGFRTYKNFSFREQYTYARDIALYEVLEKYPAEQYLFLVAPHFCKYEIFLLSSGLMQALQLFSQNDSLKVYHIIDAPLCLMDFPSRGTIATTAIEGGYQLKVTDDEHMWFMIPHHATSLQSSMGRIDIDQKKSSWQATEASIIFNDQYSKKEWIEKTNIFSWDPHLWKFVLLNKNHLLKERT